LTFQKVLIYQGNLVPSHIPSPGSSQSPTLPNWFTFIYHP